MDNPTEDLPQEQLDQLARQQMINQAFYRLVSYERDKKIILPFEAINYDPSVGAISVTIDKEDGIVIFELVDKETLDAYLESQQEESY